MAKKKTKKKGSQSSKADGDAKSGQDNSWVKYYCVVFLLLTAVVAFLFFKFRKQRLEYEAATAVAEKLITGRGIPEFDRRQVPNTIPGIAEQVHQYVEAQRGAVDTSGDIPTREIDKADASAKIVRKGMSDLRTDPNRRGGYKTIYRQLTYEKTNLRNLAKLIYNLEAKPPLRVFSIRWQLLDKGEQTERPFYRTGRPVIQVGVRQPLGTDDR